MLKVFTKIENVWKEWTEVESTTFLDINFLQVYYHYHPQVKHLFVVDNDMRLYAHIFKLTFTKAKNYLQNRLVSNIFLRIISFDVLYLTNSYITNIPAFRSNQMINLKELLNEIKDNYSLIVIPDFLYKNMIVEDNQYTRIEVEEEMVLNIRSEWNTLEDYILVLKKKYRKKVKKIIDTTSHLEIRKLGVDDLETYGVYMQDLFNQVARSSSFKGSEFNTDCFGAFVEQGFMLVDGYFVNDKLIGFSSEIQKEETMYSYFVGFDKQLNKSIPIYGRILLENINTAIKLRKNRLILGRTANEYKSNFGAVPIRSFVYLKVRNKFMRALFRPIYSRLSINEWIQRNPFK